MIYYEQYSNSAMQQYKQMNDYPATYYRSATCWVNKINVQGTWTTFYTLSDAYQWATIYMSKYSIQGNIPPFSHICHMLQTQQEVLLIQTVENPIQIILYLGHDEPSSKMCSKGYRPADVALLLGWDQDDSEDSEGSEGSDSSDSNEGNEGNEEELRQEIYFAKELFKTITSLNKTHIGQNTIMED